MSSVYFHTPGADDAKLQGSEREWLAHIARAPARGFWGLRGIDGAERAALLVNLLDPQHLGRYTDLLGLVQAMRLFEEAPQGDPIETARARDVLCRSVDTALAVFGGLPLLVGGIRLRTSNIELNTALVCGSPIVALAAKLSDWCESHCWVEGRDRMWLANLIDTGLQAGVYRQGMWVGEPAEQPGRPTRTAQKWASQGWENVTRLLRSRDDTPVVLSDSSDLGFPNHKAAGYADTGDGDTPGEWLALPDDEQWKEAMAGLRTWQPWARLGPDTLQSVFFHIPVTVLDLFADDRVRRVQIANTVSCPSDGADDARRI